MLIILAVCSGAYLSGSIPWGIVFTRLFVARDIRKTGSGNIGATNVRRTAGTLPALLTLAGDVSKGAIPVYIALQIPYTTQNISTEAVAAMAALAAFAGHLYPLFLGFRDGGKGVATAGGCFLSLCPGALWIALAVFLAAVIISNRASVGSLAAALALPPATWFYSPERVYFLLAIVIAAGIFVRHKDNIKRLREGTEPPVKKRR